MIASFSISARFTAKISFCLALLGRPLKKLILTFKVLHLLDQTLPSILSRLLAHCSLLSCEHSLMLFNFFLVLYKNPILRPSVAHQSNHHCISSLYSDHVFIFNCSNLTSIQHMLQTHAKHNLPFITNGKTTG